MEFQMMAVGQQQAPPLKTGATNDWWTYSFISRAPFYSMISPQYYDFMNRFVKHWLWWNDGYVPYFHSSEQGIPSTHLASALVSKAARKVVGGRIMFKNAGKDSTAKDVNDSIVAVAEWAQKVGLERAVKQAVEYAAAAGTSLLKLNRADDGELWAQALRFDTFLPIIGPYGEVREVTCFLRSFTNLGVEGIRAKEGDRLQAFYVVERRYFGDYTRVDGTSLKNVPLVSYLVKRQNGSVTNGEYVSQGKSGAVKFKDLPNNMKSAIGKAYAGIRFDTPMPLPFSDHLGCELVKWTEGVTGLPELPFGESLLHPIVSHLMAWDYYSAAATTDMYLGRGRVVIPKHMSGVGTGSQQGYNSGLDSFIYTQYQTNDPEGAKPTPIQFQLRSADWSNIRDRLIQDISINTGLNISTIASFISDSTAARTAREISTEENETAEFVNDKRSIVEKPINKIIDLVRLFKGLPDTVVLRWSGAGLTNRYALAEIISMAVSGGFLSKHKAVQMFNFDDDTQQVQEEYDRIVQQEAEGDVPLDDSSYFGDDGGGIADGERSREAP